MLSEETISAFLQARSLAVFGVSRDPEKYGYKVYRTLKEKGVRVFAVNPRAQEVDGDPVYPNLQALPEVPEAIVTVVPPEVTKAVVAEALAAGIRKVWMQPGSEHEEAVRQAQEAGAIVVHGGPCIMVVATTHLRSS
ncbi:MAG: CoA-binding protein [Armatimonadota bacterium]|nr:CoA-binding protein [Armatimonadota bacterium]MDW8104718.1 CoA-binding protein [Armatimonadota bacterium]MDW8290270.1 CoA-binding protein [Armatimonadota bacterium]